MIFELQIDKDFRDSVPWYRLKKVFKKILQRTKHVDENNCPEVHWKNVRENQTKSELFNWALQITGC